MRTSPEEAERYKTMFGQIASEWAKLADASSTALRSVQDPDKTLSGVIKGITEETAGVLTGQVNLERLPSIDRKLDALSVDSLRAIGLNG